MRFVLPLQNEKVLREQQHLSIPWIDRLNYLNIEKINFMRFEKQLAKQVQKLVPDVPLETISQVIMYKQYKKKLSKEEKQKLKNLEWKYENLRK